MKHKIHDISSNNYLGSASPTSLITVLVQKFTTKSSGQNFVTISLIESEDLSLQSPSVLVLVVEVVAVVTSSSSCPPKLMHQSV